MIKIYTGTPGSGKSLHLAQRIRGTLRSGRPVICNFEVDLPGIRRRHPEKLPFTYCPNNLLDPDWLISFAREYWGNKRVKEDYILLIIDESQILFNSRAWNMKGRDGWVSFFSQHRKFGYEIVLVAQFDQMIDRQMRSLIEYQFIHRKVSNFGFWGKVFTLGGLVPMFVAVQVWYPLKERLSADYFLCRKKYYSIYNTYTDFSK